MNAAVRELVAQAQTLPILERARLIESLIESLTQVDKGIEKQWANEAEDRLEAVDRGELSLQGEPAILADFRARA